MAEIIGFFRAYEGWFYFLLGLASLFFLRKFLLAWQELKGAVFGLEREAAQERLNRAAFGLVLLLGSALTIFVMVTFVAAALPTALERPTATLNLIATATTTLAANAPAQAATNALAQIPAELLTPSPLPGCLPGQAEITSPQNGQEINGVVAVMGSANIPNFGFYKFEIKRPDETAWLTIQAGNTPVIAGKLGDWDTSRLSPGEYQLALVVVDNQAQAMPACIIQVRVTFTPQATP